MTRKLSFEAIVPSHAETQAAGFIGAGVIRKRSTTYRVELVVGRAPVCTRNGAEVEWSYNETMIGLAMAVRRFFNA